MFVFWFDFLFVETWVCALFVIHFEVLHGVYLLCVLVCVICLSVFVWCVCDLVV